MEKIRTYLLITGVLMMTSGFAGKAQSKTWKVEDCINYALGKNIQIQKTVHTTERNKLYSEQAKAAQLPTLNASANQNFNWNKDLNSVTNTFGSLSASNSTNYSLNSNLSLFNGQKLVNKIKQSQLDEESGQYYTETIKESISLNIMNAFLQILFAEEQVKNAEKQIESTTEQLTLAAERLNLGVISQSDFLQIKSELANEKLTLVNAQSQLSINRINLMQLMEIPVDNAFMIASPHLDSLLNQNRQPEAGEIYNLALGIKPQIKSAELSKESSKIGVKIAKADAIPDLSLNAGLGTGYSSLSNGYGYSGQLRNRINPSVGLTLSIPIFQKKEIKTNIAVAQIAISDAELDETNTKNQLRKDIEQACQNVVSAQSEYSANIEQMAARNESYEVSTEKFRQGIMNAVDYLIEKTNLITSESKFLQSKYNLIFSYKVLDFYKGMSLSL